MPRDIGALQKDGVDIGGVLSGSPATPGITGTTIVPSISALIGTGLFFYTFGGITAVPSEHSVFPGGGFGDTIFGVSTVPSLSSVFTGGTLDHGLSGINTVPSLSTVFGGGALLPRSAGVTVFIGGEDRTEYIAPPISGSMQVGSLGNCRLPLNNAASGGAFRASYRPQKWQEVVIYIGTYRLFGGYVDTTERTLYQDDQQLELYVVNCWSYAAILDRVFIATHFELYNGGLANIIMFNVVSRYLSDRGFLWGGTGGASGPLFPPFTSNWWSFSQFCKYVTDKANWSYSVDQFKVLRMFGIDSVARPAPFTLTKDNSIFETLKPTKGGEYWNYVIVRNSQSLGSIWEDEFAGDADGGFGFYAPMTSSLTVKPQILVNDVAVTVTNPGQYGQPWEFYWLPFGVQRNPALSPLSGSDTVKVRYPIDIDYVTIAKDDAEIAIYGEVQKLLEVKDIISRTDQQIIAEGTLAKGIEDITALEVQTDMPGIEPGQILTVDADPEAGEFMVEQVDFEQLDTDDMFRFSVRASDANVQRRNSGSELFQRILSQAMQPRDRIQAVYGFTLAETIPGIENPGLEAGVPPGAVQACQVNGVCRQVTLYFKSSQTVATVAEIVVDVLYNGVSIFPSGDAAKMVWPIGQTEIVTNFIFEADPQEVQVGGIWTLDVISADPLATDGVLQITVQG